MLDLPDTSLNLWDKNIELSERQILDVLFLVFQVCLIRRQNSMGNGVESRLPFMDVNLIEFAIFARKQKNQAGLWEMDVETYNQRPGTKNIRLGRIKRGFDVSQTD